MKIVLLGLELLRVEKKLLIFRHELAVFDQQLFVFDFEAIRQFLIQLLLDEPLLRDDLKLRLRLAKLLLPERFEAALGFIARVN